jgi:hypothetical protein
MSGYFVDIIWISRLDIFSWISLDISKRYPILPKDIQEISFHIQQYPTISRDIQQYPEISRWGELPDDARLGPSKVPQPGVDLVNMAAPLCGRASTIGTAAIKSVPLLAAVLMWNS